MKGNHAEFLAGGRVLRWLTGYAVFELNVKKKKSPPYKKKKKKERKKERNQLQKQRMKDVRIGDCVSR